MVQFSSCPLVLLLLVACANEATPAATQPQGQSTAPTAEAASSAPQIAAAPSRGTGSERTRTWAVELADTDKRIAGAKVLVEKQPTSIIAAERVAGHYVVRARLTGDYRDYSQAEDWLAKGFAINAGKEIGPFQGRASLNYTLHRLDRVDTDFAKAQLGPHDNVTEASHKLFAANLALQRGQYDACAELLDASLALHESVSNLSAKAYYMLGTGNLDDAEALYRKALSMYHGTTREPAAWLHLQLGLSDLGRGKYDEALAHYRDAQGQLSGYWLIDEHIAEILTLTNKIDEAKALYLDIITRTNNPEFMDAMAGILLEEGKTEEAKAFVARARERYEALLAMYPEAAYGHALEHYLEFGDDVAFVVDLAEKNHALRPNAEAKILLTHAYLKADRAKDAQRVVEEALATPWSSADLHQAAAAVYAVSGDAAKADAQIAAAKAINPNIAGG